MQSFASFLTETFTTIYPWHISRNQDDFVRYVFAANGKMCEVDFHVSKPDNGDWSLASIQNADHEVELSFYVDLEMSVTGEGQGIKFPVFATVLDCVRDYIGKHKPNRIHFSAEKDIKSDSRSSLYTRMIEKFASGVAYTLEQKFTGLRKDKFTLKRK